MPALFAEYQVVLVSPALRSFATLWRFPKKVTTFFRNGRHVFPKRSPCFFKHIRQKKEHVVDVVPSFCLVHIKVLRVLFALDAIDRILVRRMPALVGDGQQGNRTDDY